MIDDGFVVVAREGELQEGQIISAQIGDAPVLVAKVEGQLYAMDAVCSHRHANLAEGSLEGIELACPLHGSPFDLRTGRPIAPPAVAPVATYDVVTQGGKVLVSRTPRPIAP